jgi:amino acid transporter
MAVAERVHRASAEHKGLRREVGFIGLIWASEGSIIGSGWLFGAQGALGTAGPAAIISWGIGGLAILILALVHAELGGMYPVSGGTARFPHYAFAGAAGASFGWFSWLGFVETGLTTLLVLAGASVDQAVVGTLLYRLASFWLPIPIGALAWGGWHASRRRPRSPAGDEPKTSTRGDSRQ